ncbi:MAG: hypothetical protein PHH98_04385 [Candidatus Gracilibacteria bacterium]|nr:hypothetical protein [Candidatus Gracilibacteria bacterium]
MKKILLFLCLFFSLFYYNNSFALTEQEQMLNDQWGNSEDSAYSDKSGDLTSSDFQINVDDISPGIVGQGSTTKERVNWLLGTFIQNMMIALGILSVFIMTIGSGYMILHNGQDELLSKGKSIFMSGVYAMIVALTSYYLIAIVSYLLYKN